MSGTADPHELPPLPAFQYRVQRTPHVVRSEGPVRIYDTDAADPTYEPPRVRGFGQAWNDEHGHDCSLHDCWRRPAPEDLAGMSEADVERALNGPLLWEGDQA